MTQHYTPFEGDGRAIIPPMLEIPNCTSLHVRRSEARNMIDRFEKTGYSNHSAAGGTLWVLLVWCQRHKIPYTLTAQPGLGYHIERKAPML